MMRLIKINDGYINADKIIQIYERPINPNDSDSALVTVVELEGFGTGNTGPYGETPYYYQNEVVTKKPLKEVLKLIYRDMLMVEGNYGEYLLMEVEE